MKSGNILFYFILFPFCVFAQNVNYHLSTRTHDFGKVQQWNNPPATFVLTNTGKEKILFLPTFPREDIQVVLPSGPVLPGTSAEISIRYFTGEKGSFSREVPVYLNIQGAPIVFSVKGRILDLNPNALRQCPEFGQPENNAAPVLNFGQKIIIKNKSTGEPIKFATIGLRGNKGDVYLFNSGNSGEAVHEIHAGLYSIEVQAPGVKSFISEYYINRNTGAITLELQPDEVVLVKNVPEEFPKETGAENPEVTVINKDKPDFKVEKEPGGHEVLVSQPVISIPDTGILSDILYKPNNIVFLIDVSGSMQSSYKLPLLKYSMKKLVGVLRDVDMITIVTYSTRVKVLLPPTRAGNKEMIYDILEGLKAEGYSYGAEGMEKAYEIIEENFIREGNNQLILATDGMFNSESFSEKKLYSQVRKRQKAEVITSVIGFGRGIKETDFMKNIAKNGGGNFLQILREEDANEVLIAEIKTNSRK